MKLGKSKIILFILFLFNYNFMSLADDKILSSPLINLNELKPSFDELDATNNNKIENNIIKNKKKALHQVIFRVQNLLVLIK